MEWDCIEIMPQQPVRKQVWNGTEFIEVMLYRVSGRLSIYQQDWLAKTFGDRGPRWNYSVAGNFYVMDEQVYSWFKLKWGTNE